MPAFEAAFALGYRYLETDVHATSDGVLVVFHDDTLDRLTDKKGAIAELPWSEVSKALVGGKAPIPRFEDLLATFPNARVNVEPKADQAVQPLLDVLNRTNSVDRVCVASFSGNRLKRVRAALGSKVCTGLGPFDIVRLWLAKFRIPTWRFAGQCAQVPLKQWFIPVVDHWFVKAAHRHHVEVFVWTIDDANEMRRLLDMGVDGIMTDAPEVLKSVLIERGQWSET